jgi:hypothetical protein
MQSEEATSPVRKGELTGQEIEGYRLGRLLGRGGMGIVYEALQVSLERTVAFKVLAQELTNDPALIQRFIAEARAAGRLSHANIVAVFHVGQSGSLQFYSMEYMAGGSVEDLLRKEGKLEVARTIPIIFDAARGLEYAERHGLIHRDIKPANLMLGHDEVTKICDLGIATWQPGAQDACGSPHYIAPEQAQGKPVDHRADLYALGVTWYHMLTGDTPFQGQSAREICLKHVNEAPPPLVDKGVPEDVAALVHKLMAKDPAARVQTARQLQADLAELARRYAVRETVMLRIDSVAPEDPPSAELRPPEAAADQEGGAPASRAVMWVGVTVIAVGVMIAAFLGTTVLSRRATQQAIADARAELAPVRQGAASSELADLELARDAGRALAAKFEEAGLDEPAREAGEVAEAAEKRRKELREASANERLAAARALADVPAGPPEKASVARLTKARDALSALALELPDTVAGGQAKTLHETVARRLEELEEALETQTEREQAAREAYERTELSVRDLLTGSRPERFRLARERARELSTEHAGAVIATRGADALLEAIRKAADQHASQEGQRALRLVQEGRFADARAILEALTGALGFEDLEARAQEQVLTVNAAERAARDAEREARDKARRDRVRAALERIAPDCAARRFDAAASALRAELALLPQDDGRAALELRAERLEGAARAVAALVEHVRGKGRLFVAELEFAGRAGRQRATAVEVISGVDGVSFVFDYEPGRGKTFALSALEWPQLARALDALELPRDRQVDAACLAFEVDARPDGAARLMSLQGDAGVGERVGRLLELAAAEQ